MSNAILNGEIVERDKAAIPIDDRGFLLGDGLFETLRAYVGKVFRLEDHLARLSASCRALNLETPWSEDDLAAMIDSLMQANDLANARVRLTVTRGRHGGSMSLAPSAGPTLLITAEPVPEDLDDKSSEGIKLVTADLRFSDHNPIFRHKTLNRLPHLMARDQAEKAGADEALILDEKGNVACCSTGNIFAVQYDQLFAPPASAPILPGITRKAVLEIALAEGIPIRQDFFSPIMLVGADEAFLTNSVRELEPVLEVNGHPVGSGRPGPVFRKLLERYRQMTAGE